MKNETPVRTGVSLVFLILEYGLRTHAPVADGGQEILDVDIIVAIRVPFAYCRAVVTDTIHPKPCAAESIAGVGGGLVAIDMDAAGSTWGRVLVVSDTVAIEVS